MKQNKRIVNISMTTVWNSSQMENKGTLYGDKCAVYLSDDDSDSSSLFKFPCRINAFMLVICLEGSISFMCDLEECHMEKNTIFVCKPGMIVQGKDHQGCRLALMMLNPHFMSMLNVDGRKMLPYYRFRNGVPVIAVEEDDCCELEKLCAMIAMHIKKDAANTFYDELVRASIALFFYKLMYVFSAAFSRIKVEEVKYSQSEQHFKTFVTLLSKNFRSERSVGFYASQMHVSPKYLSMLIKKVSGKSASVWIDEFVVQEAKNLLKFSDMNIQEIAYRLNFANQSFFGQYFKKHTGFSPKQYKMQN